MESVSRGGKTEMGAGKMAHQEIRLLNKASPRTYAKVEEKTDSTLRMWHVAHTHNNNFFKEKKNKTKTRNKENIDRARRARCDPRRCLLVNVSCWWFSL